VLAIRIAARHSSVPRYAKAPAGVIAAYALSPIDLIGHHSSAILDDLVIVPVGILATV
jgi:uncharacterized membrane protein YkvA (DUF1232 family)